MAISKRIFIYPTFILSCGAVALIVTAFATQYWLVSEMKVTDPDSLQTTNDMINYGLFSGSLERNYLATPVVVDIYITCQQNSCVWSCNGNSDERLNELTQLIETGTIAVFKGCDTSRSIRFQKTMWEELDSMKKEQESLEDRQHRDYEELEDRATTRQEVDQQFIDAALRVSTIVFLSIGLIFAVIGAVFAVINSAINPIEMITGIFGLYIWNAIALVSDVIVVSLWGGHFASVLSHNVAYTEVIMGDLISDGLASLGYSYWCVLGAIVLHMLNLLLLMTCQLLLNREPEPETIKVDENNDGVLFLY